MYLSILYELNVVLSELRAYLNGCSLTAPALHIVQQNHHWCLAEAVFDN